MSKKTREQRLEEAFIQFIHDVAIMRNRQKIFNEEFGQNNRLKKNVAERNVDSTLLEIGITDNMDFKDCAVEFINEKI